MDSLIYRYLEISHSIQPYSSHKKTILNLALEDWDLANGPGKPHILKT